MTSEIKDLTLSQVPEMAADALTNRWDEHGEQATWVSG